MEVPDQLQCLFSVQIEEREDSYIVELPEQEIQLGDVNLRETYRIAVLPSKHTETPDDTGTGSERDRHSSSPPVEQGDTRDVEIEGLGDQGDGIARVERGFIVIVPNTEQGERVRIEIVDVRDNVAFAEVTERLKDLSR